MKITPEQAQTLLIQALMDMNDKAPGQGALVIIAVDDYRPYGKQPFYVMRSLGDRELVKQALEASLNRVEGEQ